MYTSSSKKPAYVYYRLPDTQEVLYFEGWSQPWDGEWPQEEGFLIVPFQGEGVWIQDLPLPLLRRGDKAREEELKEGQEDYPFETFHGALEEGRLQKIVLSHRFESRELHPEQFRELCERYPHSLVYLLHTPETGTWMGATPEALLNGVGNTWSTMALAGTKTLAEEPWDEKNIKEQGVVSRFIRDILHRYASQVEESETYTMQSGALYHLRNDFRFQLDRPQDVSALLRDLHPTPAVCGLPKREALEFIRTHEGYDREFYAGFLGPVNSAQGTHLCVNIRCAQLLDDGRSLLYAGSGIMPDSTQQSEWAEVQRKAASLLAPK